MSTDPTPGKDETLDTFYQGRIQVLQKRKGYRFSVDAPLLADFIRFKASDHLCELGTGSGIISLLLSERPFKKLTALEVQPEMAELAERNVRLNHLEDRIRIMRADLMGFHAERKFEVVFSNPPYIKRNQGHLSASSEKSIAKHELTCNIFGIMQKTEEIMHRRGRAYFVFPAKRWEDFSQAVKNNRMHIKQMRFVQPRREAAPNLFLAACGFDEEKMKTLTPLILFNDEGRHSDEAETIFAGR